MACDYLKRRRWIYAHRADAGCCDHFTIGVYGDTSSITILHARPNRARREESLGMIAKCQEAYFLEYDTYSANKNRIGFYMKRHALLHL